MATITHYIALSEIAQFHRVDINFFDQLVEQELLTTHIHDQQRCIMEDDLDELEMMLRLHEQLGINLPGIETILHMRQRILLLQRRLALLEGKVGEPIE